MVNWSGKQSLTTGMGLKNCGGITAEEKASLRLMWRVCARAGLQPAPGGRRLV